MKEVIRESVKNAGTLTEVRDALFGVFRNLRAQGHSRIGYVSGAITADGRENISRNIQRLDRFTEHIRGQHDFPIFSATDVFDGALFERLDAAGFVNADWKVFWREVLGANDKFVTDIFMTPRWEKSHGAKDEHKVAQEIEIAITYIEKELE